MTNNLVTTLPSKAEADMARASSRQLAVHLKTNFETQTFSLKTDSGNQELVEIPTSAVRLFIELLAEMANGNAIHLIPVHAELTTQEAADILKVSRPFVVKLLDSGDIPYHKVGTHRRVLYRDIATYKQRIDQKREHALDELAAQAQNLGMGY